MKVVSWNVNGMRACWDKGLKEFLRNSDADIICLQETKLQNEFEDMNNSGYYRYYSFSKRKGYSGTTCYVKREPLRVEYGIGDERFDDEGRAITLEYEEFMVVNCYVPNSKGSLERFYFRMDWDAAFKEYLARLQRIKPVIVCGDFNVAYERKNGIVTVTPSETAVTRFENELEELILNHKGSQKALIDKLNAKLTGWASYHKVSNAFFAFRQIDVFVKAHLIKLCEMKHPTWSIEKIRDRYWYLDFDGQYVYALKDKSDVRVKRLADTVIVEHRKIKTNANPYLDAEYLDSRNDKREIHTVSGKYKSVWNRQGGRCYYCGKKILADHRKEIVQIDLSKGTGAGNLAYIHWQCQNSPVEYAFTDTMPICENDIIGLIESLDKSKRKKGLKFEQLDNYFQKCTKNSVSLTFKDIEEIIGEPLCKSAYKRKQYWHSTRENSISKAWLMNGYSLRRIYMDKKRIVFQRTDHKNAPVTIPEVFLNGRVPNDAKCELENYFAFIIKKYGL